MKPGHFSLESNGGYVGTVVELLTAEIQFKGVDRHFFTNNRIGRLRLVFSVREESDE